MGDGTDAGHGEPVLVALTAPARRSLVDGLVRAIGSGKSGTHVLDADAPDAEVADFLAEAAHADSGFVARTADGPRALAIVAATAAALCGEDIRAALAEPDITFLTSLKPPAIEAVRGVLLAIETTAADDLGGTLSILTARK